MTNILAIVTFTQWQALRLKNIKCGHPLMTSAEIGHVIDTPTLNPPQFPGPQQSKLRSSHPHPHYGSWTSKFQSNFTLISSLRFFPKFLDLAAKFCYQLKQKTQNFNK